MEFINYINAVILGIIEGITEWLPISSTGHLILAEEFFGLKNISPEFTEMFNVVVQLGAILAVIVIFWKKLWPFAIGEGKKVAAKKQTFSLWLKVIIAVLPAAVIGLPLDDWMDEHLHNPIVVAATLIIYGVAFIVVENLFKNKTPKIETENDLTYKTAFLIGCFQVLSLIPGTSRSGSTILGGILLGTSRTAAAEFSFFLAIPVMLGASLLKVLKYVMFLMESGLGFSIERFVVLAIGMVVAFVVSVLAIKFLLAYIKKKDFKAFGWYRIVLGLLVLAYFYIVK